MGYRGELKLNFLRVGANYTQYLIGERIGQLMIMPFPKIHPLEVEELSDSERGFGGFGHTGK